MYSQINFYIFFEILEFVYELKLREKPRESVAFLPYCILDELIILSILCSKKKYIFFLIENPYICIIKKKGYVRKATYNFAACLFFG